MKLNPEFVIQAVADSTMLVPVGDAATKFHGVMQLNKTAAFIVECLNDDKEVFHILHKPLLLSYYYFYINSSENRKGGLD